MKKKSIYFLSVILPLTLSLSSCNFIFNNTGENTTNDNNNNNNNNNDTTKNNTTENNNDNTSEEKPKPKEIIIEERDPVIKSDEYHTGFDKKIYSSLFPYEPKVRTQLPKINISTPDGSNDFATMSLNYMGDIYTAKKENRIKYEDCSVKVSNCESNYSFDNVSGLIKLRGNASCYSPKKAFSLKFNEKRTLLGLNNSNKFKKYVLDPLYYDPSFLKESTALYLGKQMFNYDNLFTSDTTPVELYINDTYWGVYLLKESIQVNKNRVNIDDIEKREPLGKYSGIDTGYLFEYDGYGLLEEEYGLNPIFRIDYNNNAPLKSLDGKTTYQANDTYYHEGCMVNEFTLKSDIYSQDQLDFLSSYVGNIYKIIYEAVYNKQYYVFNSNNSGIIKTKDLTSKEVIDKVIDINSFVDMYLLQEMCCNNDLYWGSQYFQLDMSSKGNKKLTFSSAWDYDWGFGRGATMNSTGKSGTNVNTLYAANQCNQAYTNAWYLLLIHEDWFMNLVKEKWQLLVKHGVLHNSLHYIDEFTLIHKNYYKANFEKWPFEIYGNEPREYQINYDDLPKQANYLFKWLAGKFNYLNTVFGDNTELFTIS